MLKLRLEEIIVVLFFTLLHLGFYQHFVHLAATEKNKPLPILIELIRPLPKPVPVPLLKPEPKITPPKPLAPAKPKPSEPKTQKVIKKPVLKKPVIERVVQKPRLQQKSLVQVQADVIEEKEIVERPQQLNEAVVKKPDNKPEEKVEAPAPVPEPEHEAVVTQAGYGGCRSALNHYPEAAREQGLEGSVKIKVKVLADGSVANASIVKSSGESILDETALENVRDCEFEPAQKDGVPIASTVVIPIRFKLD